MEISLEVYTERSVPLPAPSEVVAHYFSENETLLSLLVGPERVTKLASGQYRVATRGFHALGFSLTPSFEVHFIDSPARTEMMSQDCQLLHSNALDLDLSATFRGEAQFQAAESGTVLFCWTRAWAQVRLPIPPLVPHSLVKGTLQALMQGTLDSLSARFVPLIQSDFERWQDSRISGSSLSSSSSDQ